MNDADREKYERLARDTGPVSVNTALKMTAVREGMCWIEAASADVMLAIRPRPDGKLVLWRRPINTGGRRKPSWCLAYLSLELFDARCVLVVAADVPAAMPAQPSRFKYAGKPEHEVRGWRPR